MKIFKELIAVFAFMPGILTAQEVIKVQVGDNQDHGITYNLPATGVYIHTEAECTVFKAGVFAQYAEKYLGLTGVPLEDNVSWELLSVDMDYVTLPDTARTYHINFSDKMPMPTFYLGKSNLLLGINREPQKTKVKTPVEEPAAEDVIPELHAANVMNEELLKAGSKAKQAEIAARQIFRIRESRMNLLTGDVDAMPSDGLSFQLILDNLKAQEAAYMELFTGVSAKSVVKRQYYIKPDRSESKVLFRFSKHFGFVDADDMSGEPYKISVTVTDDKRHVPILKDAKGKPKPVNTGIAYTVPGRASVEVSFKGESLCKEEWTMGQFGHVEFLPSIQFVNKKAPCSALFDAETGAIQLFNGEQ